WVVDDRVQAQTAGTRLPTRARAVPPQARQLLPVLPAVGGAEESRVLDAGVHRIGVGERRLEVPDALELPGFGRAVVPLVGTSVTVVGELIVDRLPALAA